MDRVSLQRLHKHVGRDEPEPMPISSSLLCARRNLLLTGIAAGLWWRLPAWAKSPTDLSPREPEGVLQRAWPAQKAPPKWRLRDLNEQWWSSENTHGYPVVLNFWASWCEPCRTEMPSLELISEQYESQGLRVLAVNFRETDAALRRHLSLYPTSLNVLRDRDGETARSWGVRIFPTTVLIDRSGSPRRWIQGEMDWTSTTGRAWLSELVEIKKSSKG